MNWQNAKLVAETLCLLSVAGSAAFFAWDQHQTEIVARTSLATDASTSNQMLLGLTRQCNVKNVKGTAFYTPFFSEGSTMPCGTFADLNQTLATLRYEISGIKPAADNLNTSIDIFNAKEGPLLQAGTDTVTAIGNMAKASTGTLDEATALLASANDKDKGLPAVLSHTDAAVGQITASLTSQDAANPGTITQFNTFFAANQKDWTLTSYNVEQMTSHGAGIMFDFQNVTDKATADYMRSKTPWGQFRQKLSDSYDIGAMVARHF